MDIVDYKEKVGLAVAQVIALGLDFGVVPLIAMACWNQVVPQTFDTVHALDYKGAFLLRIALWAITSAMFGKQLYKYDKTERTQFYVQKLHDAIIKNKNAHNSPPISRLEI